MFEISRRKQTPVKVVLPAGRAAKAKPIAQELIRCLKAACGGRYSVVAKPPAAGVRRVELVIDPDLTRRGGNPRVPPLNVVAWACDGKNALRLAGNNVESLWLAVYAFLEEVVDCRWFFPGELGEDIPKRKQLRLGKLDVTKTPSFAARDFRWWPADFQRKKLAGGFQFRGGHSYASVIPPKVAKKHPEYFSLIGNERQIEGTQLCVTNPDVEDYGVRYVLGEIEKDPDQPVISLGPNDNNRFCECRRCTAMNLGRKLPKGKTPSPPQWVTRSVFDFSNRVAARVAAEHPDKLIATFAYARTKQPPDHLRIHDNVLVWYCSQPGSNWQGRSGRQRLQEDTAAWEKVARHIGIFDYLVNQAWPDFPRPITRLLGWYMKVFHRNGVRYYYTQCGNDWGVHLPNYYLVSALAWDVTRDPQAVLADMYARCFGPAAQAVRRYFDVMEAAVRRQMDKEPGPGVLGVYGSRRSHEAMAAIYTPEVLAEAQAALDDARKAARTKRHRDRLQLVLDGFEFTKLGVEAARKTFEYELKFNNDCFAPFPWRSSAGNFDYHSSVIKLQAFGRPCIERFQELRRLWRRYARLRARLEKRNVLTHRYAHGGSFFPLERLDNVWKLYTRQIDTVPLVNIARENMRVM